jgi:hypothetical protein
MDPISDLLTFNDLQEPNPVDELSQTDLSDPMTASENESVDPTEVRKASISNLRTFREVQDRDFTKMSQASVSKPRATSESESLNPSEVHKPSISKLMALSKVQDRDPTKMSQASVSNSKTSTEGQGMNLKTAKMGQTGIGKVAPGQEQFTNTTEIGQTFIHVIPTRSQA